MSLRPPGNRSPGRWGSRSAGTFSSALAMAAATGQGTLDLTVVIGGAGSVTCFANMASGADATNGGSPPSISYSTHAKE